MITRVSAETETSYCDAHVHVRDAIGLERARAAGVTAIRDAGLGENAMRGHGFPSGPYATIDVVSARWAIFKKGGYGSVFGVPVENCQEISNEVRTLVRAGAGVVKVMASGIVSLREPGKITAGGFSAEELTCVVQESSRAGLPVMAHANGESAIIAVARAGVRSVEHGFFMTRRALEVIAKKKIFWTPTVGALVRASETVSAEAKAYIRNLVVAHLKMIRYAHEMGVPLAIGTDCILPDDSYERAYRSELSFFEEAGLSRSLVRKIATEGGRTLLGL